MKKDELKIVVYLSLDYKKAEHFMVNDTLTIDEIKEVVNITYPMWYYFDVWTYDQLLDK